MSAPEIIPVDSGGGIASPKPVPAPIYRAPVAARPPLPSEGITVMNRDGSFYSSDLGPPRGDPFSGGYSSESRLIEMMMLSRLFAQPQRKQKKSQPKIIIVQVPANSLPIAPDSRALVGNK